MPRPLPDATEMHRRISERVRELRQAHGYTLAKLADAVNRAAGLAWREDTVTNVQNPNHPRRLSVVELLALGQVFRIPVERIADRAPARPDKRIGRPPVGEPTIPAGIGAAAQSREIKIALAPGQLARLAATAQRGDVTRAVMTRALLEIGLRAVEDMDDDAIRDLGRTATPVAPPPPVRRSSVRPLTQEQLRELMPRAPR